MNNISCVTVTKEVKNLANSLGYSDNLTSNLVSAWQTLNNTYDFPTKEDISKFVKENRDNLKATRLATPTYTVRDYSSNLAPVSYINGAIVLTKLASKDPLKGFFAKNTNEALKELVTTPNQAYRYLLWKENAKISGLSEADAEQEAIDNLILFNEQLKDSNSTVTDIISDDNSNVKAQFGEDLLKDEKAVTAVQKQIDEEKAKKIEIQRLSELLGNYATPKIGLDNVKIDESNSIIDLNKKFSIQEREDRITLISQLFSDVVDQALDSKIEEIEDLISNTTDKDEIYRLKEVLRDLNDSVKGRQTIINNATLVSLFNKVKSIIEESANISAEEYNDMFDTKDGQHIVDSYQKMLDNYYPLLEEAMSLIEKRENFRIVTNNHKYFAGDKSINVIDGYTASDSKSEDDEEKEFGDDETGKRVNGSEGWSIESRFIDPHESASKSTKKILSTIVREKFNGDIDTDDLGNTRYLDEEYAHSVLINKLSDMIEPNDLDSILEEMSIKYPWVNQVINSLSNDDAVKSAFYTDFRKDFINYYRHGFSNETQSEIPISLNSNTSSNSIVSDVTNNYNQGEVLSDNSIYTSSRELNRANIEKNKIKAESILRDINESNGDNYDEISNTAIDLIKSVGIKVNDDSIQSILRLEDGTDKLAELINNIIDLLNSTSNMSDTDSIVDYGKNKMYYRNIANTIGDYQESDHIQSFRVGDKTRYSYTSPNYINTMFKYLKSPKYFKNYINNEFKQFDFFFNKNTNEWNSEWLRLFENDENFRKQFDTREVIDINGNPYNEWSTEDIKMGFMREYLSIDINPKNKMQYAYYSTPIFSDSPVAMFVKGPRYTGTPEEVESTLIPLFRKIVKQELERMALVDKRELAGVKKIDSFDKKGKEFNFFPEFNNIKVNGQSLKDYMRSLIDSNDVESLDDTIDYYVKSVMDDNFNKFIFDPNSDLNLPEDSFNDFNLELIHRNILNTDDPKAFEDLLHEYFWNQAYATTQIIQLTATDLAFFKDDVDFQKRYKESIASGNKLNTNSKYGKDIERTIYLIDEEVTSRNYNNIKYIIDESVKNNRMTLDEANSIKDMFTKISATDAQAFRTLPSMRSVLDMMGLWSDDMQSAMDRLENNQFDINDFNIIWQTIKPFMFTQVSSPNGLGGQMKVPHHNKNSEFLLMAAYDLTSSSIRHSHKMRALNKWMLANNIDVVQYNTAVKVGCQGAIDLRYSPSKLEYYSKAMGLNINTYDDFKSTLDSRLKNDELTQDEYNHIISNVAPSEEEISDLLDYQSKINGIEDPEVIHSLPYRDYVVQQPNPEHIFDTIAVLGSQFKNLITSDISNDPSFRININGKILTKQELKHLYNNLLVNDYLDDYKSVTNKFEDIHSLQKALLESIKGSTKFNRDLINALQIVKTKDPMTGQDTETFNIPLDCPTITDKIQQITNSIFKNKITKQSIKGGACVLVSNIGYSKDLNLLYNEDGKSIKGVECYMPAYTKQFFKPFLTDIKDSTGAIIGKQIDINKIKKMDKSLLQAIGYRIPTEDKYSMLPLIIKDFLPTQLGSAIMLPADITAISGCDFDVDKVFLMFKEFKIFQPYDLEKAKYDYNKEQALMDIVNSKFGNKDDAIKILKESPSFKSWFNEYKEDYKSGDPIIFTYKYNMDKSVEEQSSDPDISRKIRHNLLIDISNAVLSHPDTADKILNPGNFNKLEHIAGIASISTNLDLLQKWANSLYGDIDFRTFTMNELDELVDSIYEASPDQINKFIKNNKDVKTQLSPNTFIYNHRQNMTGGALIGIYANNTTLQAKFQDSNLGMAEPYVFKLNGIEYNSLHDIYSKTGERISKNCANFSAASVDNVKKPVLDKIMQNTKTAKVACTTLRAGVPIKDIGLLFSTPIVRNCVFFTGEVKSKDLSNYIKLELSKYAELFKASLKLDSKEVLSSGLSSKEMLKSTIANKIGFIDPKISENKIRAAMIMQNIIDITDVLNDATSISRADSPNAGMKPSISGLINQINKINIFDPTKVLTGYDAFLTNTDKIDYKSSQEKLRDTFMNHATPMLDAAYNLGIRFGYDLMSKYYNKLSNNQKLINSIYGYVKDGRISDVKMTSFLRDLTTYRLSSTKLFGDSEDSTFNEKRDYYLYAFPKKFLDLKLSEPKVANIGIIKKMTVSNGTIGLINSGRLSNITRESYMKDLDSMLYSNDPILNKLATDLLMYSYYKEGLNFGPNNYGYFFSSVFLSSFPEVINALKDTTPVDAKFMNQFIANHTDYVPYINPKIDKYEMRKSEDGSISLNTKYIKSIFGENYPFIRTDSGIYYVDFSSDERTFYYPSYMINDTIGSRYNANSTVAELSDYKTDEDLIKANALIGSTSMSSVISNSNDYSITTDLDDSTYSEMKNAEKIDDFKDFDNLEMFDDDNIDFEDLGISANNVEEVDKFNLDDSQNELDEPLCR